jgi:hypothetical protein
MSTLDAGHGQQEPRTGPRRAYWRADSSNDVTSAGGPACGGGIHCVFGISKNSRSLTLSIRIACPSGRTVDVHVELSNNARQAELHRPHYMVGVNGG